MKKHSSYNLWIRVILFFAITIILTFSFQTFILPILRTLFNNGEQFPATLEINIIRMMNGIVGICLVYMFLTFDRRKLSVVGFSWEPTWGKEWILIAIPIAIIGLIPTVIIELLFNIIIIGHLLNILEIILTLLVTIFAIGLGEEILFRGYLQSIIETKYSFSFAALISALMFGILHFWLAAGSRNLFHMIAILFSAFVIGLTFSYIYKISNYNLTLAVAIHGFWDFFLFIFQSEFMYENWIQVIMEILASIIGALVIFLFVHYYKVKRLDKVQNI